MKEYRTLQLYRVGIEYTDVMEREEWDKAMRGAPPKARGLPPLPASKSAVYHAAVWPDYGGDPLKRAADLAIRAVIGPPECWGKWQPIVSSVRCLGSVAIEMAGLVEAATPESES